jgi:hypothetical protein
MLLADPTSRRLHMALELGHFGVKMHRSDDTGETWSEVPVPTFPPKPEYFVDKDPVRGSDLP